MRAMRAYSLPTSLTVIIAITVLNSVTTAAPMGSSWSNVADTWKVANDGKSFASAFGDLERTGLPYLFVTNSGSNNALYKNTAETHENQQHGTDITDQVGLTDHGASRGAAFGDFNGDGFLEHLSKQSKCVCSTT